MTFMEFIDKYVGIGFAAAFTILIYFVLHAMVTLVIKLNALPKEPGGMKSAKWPKPLAFLGPLLEDLHHAYREDPGNWANLGNHEAIIDMAIENEVFKHIRRSLEYAKAVYDAGLWGTLFGALFIFQGLGASFASGKSPAAIFGSTYPGIATALITSLIALPTARLIILVTRILFEGMANRLVLMVQKKKQSIYEGEEVCHVESNDTSSQCQRFVGARC